MIYFFLLIYIMPKSKKLGENEMPKGKYKILPIMPDPDTIKIDRNLPRPIETMLMKGGGCLGIFASPGSGKSVFISNLFLREALLKDFFDGGLYLVSPTCMSDSSSRFLVDYADFVETEYSEDLMSEIYNNIMMVPKEDRLPSAMILDDCMGSIKQNSIMNKISSVHRHMRSLLVFSIQNIKGLNPNIRSNLSHSIVFYQPSQKQLEDTVQLHSMFGGEDTFLEKYNEATSQKYGFLLADFRDMKLYKWGADLNEPVEIWSKYDANGNITELNKGNIKSEKK